MSSVLERPRSGAKWNHNDWHSADVGTSDSSHSSIVGWPQATREYHYRFLNRHVVIQSQTPPRWIETVVAALDELGGLPDNWDSYGAQPIRHASLLAAVELLANVMHEETPLPTAIPTNRGTVQLEWHTRGIDLEIEVRGSGRLHVMFEDSRRGTEWEGDVGADLTRVVKFIHQLTTTGVTRL